MKRFHLPSIDGRYWAAITLASIFGTNLGDLYAHESGLGIVLGLAVLAVLAAGVFLAERSDRRPGELYYWLVIIVIRTGATNIADYLQFRVRVPQLLLAIALAGIIALFGWLSQRHTAAADGPAGGGRLPGADAKYWVAMLGAGVFGTVVGDVTSHWIGEGAASLLLGALLAVALLVRNRVAASLWAAYWLTVAVARTAGTAIGDFIAESKSLAIGLPIASAISGAVFVGLLLLWRNARPVEEAR